MSAKSEKALTWFKEGLACSQAVLTVFAEDFGLEHNLALRVSAGLGGGIGRTGEMCGAVTGAILALGLKYGTVRGDDKAAKEQTYAAAQELIRQFAARHGSASCRELLGCNLGTPEGLQLAREKNFHANQCPPYVASAVELAEQLMQAPSAMRSV